MITTACPGCLYFPFLFSVAGDDSKAGGTLFKTGHDMAGGAVSFVKSALFDRTFRDGMALVQETAVYLDGEGCRQARKLKRMHALAYAGAAMHLTTQMMQIASWLLVIRDVREGRVMLDEVAGRKFRIEKTAALPMQKGSGGLPARLVALSAAAEQLHARLCRLDRELFPSGEQAVPVFDAAGRQKVLMQAFGCAT